MICPSPLRKQPRSSHFVLLGLAGMLLAYSGCAVGSGARTADTNSAASGAGSVTISDSADGGTETPAITLDPRLLGAKPAPRQQTRKQSKTLQLAGKTATDTPRAPVASTDGPQPEVSVTTTPRAAPAAAVMNPVDKPVKNPVQNANWEAAQAPVGRNRGPSPMPRLAPVARRDAAVERARYLADEQSR